ncbi:MAG TPA: M48 family metalloprotease, partial [Atribacterota bacterium]|nr:M48 family metalloprotease [Atribacterota bacterium]
GLLGELTTITVLNNYRREYEEEADLTALELLNKSPIYHPLGLLTYFERVGSEQLLKPNQNLGIFQTHPDVEERVKKVKQYLKENGITINRRLTTNYLTVNGAYKEQANNLLIARIFINDEEMFRFSGKEEENLCQKLEEIVLKFDQSLRLDLDPYEIILYSDEEQKCTLRIGSEKIVSLSREEANFQGLTATEVLEKARERISEILWQLKLELPILFIKN